MKITQIIQIIVSILLIIVILMQNQGAGLSGVFGGGGNVFRTKRGVEKSLFVATIVLACLFFAVSLLNLFYNY
ncbi:preprotein translocase subunit SecG [Candidatus Parcubacteria bacterium]|nr:MAG: preprotein translocase subunit SecG [Candidatus Parcubacteria bacterium]